MIKDMFGIQVIVSVNVINHVILMNIQSIQVVSVKKKKIDQLVEECTENNNETKIVKKTLDKSEDRCNSYVVYRALFWTFFIFFLTSIGISIYFVYCNYVNRSKYDLSY